jgi:hypothetical protein
MEQLTEYTDMVSFVIILHEELVTVHYVFREVPRERLVENPSSGAEERRDDARFKVRPDAGLLIPLVWLIHTYMEERAW